MPKNVFDDNDKVAYDVLGKHNIGYQPARVLKKLIMV